MLVFQKKKKKDKIHIKQQGKHVNDAMSEIEESLSKKGYLYQVKPFRIAAASIFLPSYMTLL